MAISQSYALCFLLAFAAFVISWIGLALNREPDSPTIKTHPSFLYYIKQLPNVLQRDRNYRIYLVSRSVANLGSMAAGFFIVYGAEQYGVDGAMAGFLTGAMVGSQTLWNLLWGVLGDRKGHKLVLTGSALMMALAALAPLLMTSPAVLWVVFFLLGAAAGGETVSGLNIILEFCAPEDRPTYIGLTNTLLAPLKALAPILGGWLATWLGYSPLFGVAFMLSLLGSGLLAWWVREPRDHPNYKSLETQ
jgi:MFS family permease